MQILPFFVFGYTFKPNSTHNGFWSMKKILASAKVLKILRYTAILLLIVGGGLGLFIKQSSLESKITQMHSDIEQMHQDAKEEKGKFFELRKNFAGLSGVEYGAEILFRMSGSNTVGDELAPALAAGYLREMGAVGPIQINRFPKSPNHLLIKASIPGQTWPQGIEIVAEGSETAISDLGIGKADIAMLSRKVVRSELDYLRQRGKRGLDPETALHHIAKDGLAIIVHPDNPVSSLSMEQLQAIFTGKTRDWILIGGGNGQIRILTRNKYSSTRRFFSTSVLNGEPLYGRAEVLKSTRQITERVLKDKNAIGVVAMSYVGQAKPLALVGKEGVPIHPTGISVASKDYPLYRSLYMYTPSKSNNFFAREFSEYAASDAAREIVSKNGFVPVGLEEDRIVLQTLSENLPSGFQKIIKKSKQLRLQLRFEANQVRLDNKARKDLTRLKKFIEDNRTSLEKVYLVGLSDNNGQAEENLRLSLERAQKVKQELSELGLDFIDENLIATGFGDAKPIAPNTTEEGRKRNRRVEIWVQRK